MNTNVSSELVSMSYRSIPYGIKLMMYGIYSHVHWSSNYICQTILTYRNVYGKVSVSVSLLLAPKAHKLKMQQDRPINGRLHIEATTILNVNTHQKSPQTLGNSLVLSDATRSTPMKGHEPPKNNLVFFVCSLN